MTFKQIKEIKTRHNGLILDTHLTNMFTNVQWASTWKIKFMTEQNMKELFKYLDNNNLNYFLSSIGIHIQ